MTFTVTIVRSGGLHTTDVEYEGDDRTLAIDVWTDLLDIAAHSDFEVRLIARA